MGVLIRCLFFFLFSAESNRTTARDTFSSCSTVRELLIAANGCCGDSTAHKRPLPISSLCNSDVKTRVSSKARSNRFWQSADVMAFPLATVTCNSMPG